MIIVWIIGLVLCLIMIDVFRKTRAYKWEEYKDRVYGGASLRKVAGDPILTLGWLLLFIILALIPILSIITFIVMLVVWIFNIGDDWTYVPSKRFEKVKEFLSKPIT